MNNEELLKKIIEKSISNGYYNKYFDRNGWEVKSDFDPNSEKIEIWIQCGEGATFSLSDIIFDHEFSKALFGTEEINKMNGETKSDFIKRWDNPYVPDPLKVWRNDGHSIIPIPAWQYHLQLLALAEDRMEYLEKFL